MSGKNGLLFIYDVKLKWGALELFGDTLVKLINSYNVGYKKLTH